MTTVGHHIQAAIEPIKTKPEATIRRFTKRDSIAKTVHAHTRLWTYYDNIPEIHYWVGVASNITRMLHYFPGIVIDDVERDEPEPDDDPEVLALWESIGGEQRMREMISELVAHRRIVGEAYIVPLDDDGKLIDPDDPGEGIDGEPPTIQWDVVSSIELRELIGLTVGADIGLDVPAWRVWKRHPRQADYADPPLASVKAQCEALIALDGRVLADSRARLSAGILFLPDSLTSVQTESGNSFDKELESAILDPIDTPDSSDTVAPLVAYIRPEEIAAVKHMTFGREAIADAIAQREELIRRIAAGMDAPAELLLGMGDLNHWSAWLIQDSTYTQHIDPDVVDVLDDLSVWWQSMLQSAGIDPTGRVLWRDPNPALRRPDRLNDVIAAFDRYSASEESLRDAAGLVESDAPTEEEIERRIRIAQLSTPLALAQGAGSDISEPPTPGAVGDDEQGIPNSDNPSDGDTPPPPPQTGLRPRLAVVLAAADDQTRAIASGLSIVDRSALSAIDREAETQIRRARARAIDRVITEARNTPGFDVTANRREWFDTLTPDQIRAIAGDTAGVDPDDFDAEAIADVLWAAETERVDVLETNGVTPQPSDPNDDINAGAALILAALIAAATAAVLGARPDPDQPGEIPDRDVVTPMGDIRRAITVAGGTPASDITPTTASDSNLIGNGQRSIDDLARAGLATVAYEWVYGDIPRRPFPPHRRMDGVQFETFDDDVLAPPAAGAWLGSRMFPGDHKGCRCTYRRVLAPIESLTP